MPRRFWVETLGCPKNQVDSDKLTGALLADGLVPADAPGDADLVVVNTCAFIEDARKESVDTILAMADARGRRAPGRDRLHGRALRRRAGRGPARGRRRRWLRDRGAGRLGRRPVAAPDLDLLHLARPRGRPVGLREGRRGLRPGVRVLRDPELPWPAAVAGDRRDPRRGRRARLREIVLVAQDLAAYGRDQGVGERAIVPLVGAVPTASPAPGCSTSTRPTSPTSSSTPSARRACPTSTSPCSTSRAPLVRRMRRWGDGERFLERIEAIRGREPDAAFRSNFIVGYPGETEDDHDVLLAWVEEAQIDWCGFFAYSEEAGTYAADLDGKVDRALMAERLAELRELQEAITGPT